MSPFKILNPRNPHGVFFIKAVFYCIRTKMWIYFLNRFNCQEWPKSVFSSQYSDIIKPEKRFGELVKWSPIVRWNASILINFSHLTVLGKCMEICLESRGFKESKADASNDSLGLISIHNKEKRFWELMKWSPKVKYFNFRFQGIQKLTLQMLSTGTKRGSEFKI